MEEQVHSLAEMRAVAERVLTRVTNAKSTDHATILGLQGDLGAGKTAFTKQLAALLGIRGTVKSPTFVLEQVYEIPTEEERKRGFGQLVHIDAYRMENDTELEHLNWAELSADPRNIIVVEWPERVGGKLPKDTWYIQFAFVDEETRKVTF